MQEKGNVCRKKNRNTGKRTRIQEKEQDYREMNKNTGKRTRLQEKEEEYRSGGLTRRLHESVA